MIKLFLVFIFFFPVVAAAQLSVAPIFSDNMVLQRDKPIRIWGTGIPGRQVVVIFDKEKKVDIVASDSTWQIEFKMLTASVEPRAITILSGREEIVFNNLLVGDLWLCLGQSNMEWPMRQEKHFQEALATSDQPLLRFYNPKYAGKGTYGKTYHDSTICKLTVKDFYDGRWESSNQLSIKDISAVAYYFGSEIIQQENIPIGLINLAIGGAPIETFIDRDALQRNAHYSAKVTGNWLTNDALPVWIRERGFQNVGDNDDVSTDDLGPSHAFKPGFAFAAGIKPITSLPLKGILWYQGESNAQEMNRVKEYGNLIKLMVQDYRQNWQEPSLPFYFVQLSSIDTVNYKGHLWPAFRDEQRKSLDEIKFSGMAVSSDIGDKNDVHPRDKKTVGGRLAVWALHYTYGNKDIIPSGPLPQNAKYIDGNVVVRFQHTADGLAIQGSDALKGFSIDGIRPVPAKIVGNTVVIATPQKPQFIYYGWKPFTDANLVNSVNLPASTFKLKVQ